MRTHSFLFPRLLTLIGLLGVLASAAPAQLILVNSVVGLTNSTNSATTTLLEFTLPGFNVGPRPLQVTSVFDVTFSSLRGNTQGVIGTSAVLATFADENNVGFGKGTPFSSFTFVPVGGATASATSAQVVHGWNPPAAPFSLTQKYVIVQPAFTSFHGQIMMTIDRDTTVTAVPEPGEWAVMGVLVGSVGMLVVRKRRAA